MSDEWRKAAACRGTDPELFFPEGRGRELSSNAEAVAICVRCPVRRDCLESELARGLPQFGWSGGKSPSEREAIIRKRKRTRRAAA